MIAWMLYSVSVALIVAAAARAAEWLAKLAGYPVRWIWVGALVLIMFLAASAVARGTERSDASATTTRTIERDDGAGGHAAAWWLRALGARAERLRGSLDAPLRGAVGFVRRTMSPAADGYVVALVSAMSVGLAFVLVGVEHRFRTARRGWPLVTMQGVEVRVAPRVGPVVMGLVRPEIVVPRWLLDRDGDDQRLVVAHEREHVRARDPLLLGLGWVAIVVAPWNLVLWYLLSRLRLAVELDCDARVLRRGAAPQSYGFLLIDVAQHASALRFSALALVDNSSHLHQRILAMKPRVPRFARLRGGLAAAFASVGVLVACQATLPVADNHVDSAAKSAIVSKTNKGPFTGLVFIDGVRVPASRIDSLDRKQIESVEILKGAAAVTQYGPDAVNGVILIKSKPGGGAR